MPTIPTPAPSERGATPPALAPLFAAFLALGLGACGGGGGGGESGGGARDDSPTTGRVDGNAAGGGDAPTDRPDAPAEPVAPLEPGAPVEPGAPAGPGTPVAPAGPGTPVETAIGPLPSPPMSPPPGTDSEPVRETLPVSTLTDVVLVRDPQGRIVDTGEPRITDAQFDAGPLAPDIVAPADIDLAVNRPPYFADLEDADVLAGDTLQLLLQPLDPDGGIPGMYPEDLPPGARYVDNLDGTRTLNWRPLQPDVGIRTFRIVAIDAADSRLRVTRTVRVRTRLPADPSTIPNLRPGINAVRRHVVRVGDPVVVPLKGTDPNGTTPALGLLNPPAGSTFVAHRTEPGMRVLRFVPDAAGTIELQVVARDSEDASLETSMTVEIEVRDASDFLLPGVRLRELGAQRDLRVGFAALNGFYQRPDGALYGDIAGAEYDFVTSENQLKSDLVNPLPGVYRWASADNLVAWAKSRDVAVHGHTLVWYAQVPGWIKRSALATREGHMREYVDRVMRRYAGDIPVWDVVNESLEADGTLRDSVWHQAMGERYIDVAFRQARASDPDATLLYNDYDVAWNGPKSDGLFRLLEGLKARDVPLDGVGFQLHVFARFDAFDEVRANFRRAAALGLDVYVTELDVSMADDDTEAMQADVYGRLLSICLEESACKAFQSWGFTDMYSWRRNYRPLPFDAEYAPKPAYLALQRRLGEN